MRAHVVALKDGIDAFEAELNAVLAHRAPEDLVDLKLTAAQVGGVVAVIAVVVTRDGPEF